MGKAEVLGNQSVVLAPQIDLSLIGSLEWRLKPGAEVKVETWMPGGLGFTRRVVAEGHSLIVRGRFQEESNGRGASGTIVEEIGDSRGVVGWKVKFSFGQGDGLIQVAPRPEIR